MNYEFAATPAPRPVSKGSGATKRSLQQGFPEDLLRPGTSGMSMPARRFATFWCNCCLAEMRLSVRIEIGKENQNQKQERSLTQKVGSG